MKCSECYKFNEHAPTVMSFGIFITHHCRIGCRCSGPDDDKNCLNATTKEEVIADDIAYLKLVLPDGFRKSLATQLADNVDISEHCALSIIHQSIDAYNEDIAEMITGGERQ